MPSFSKRSRDRLRTCRPELQDLFNEVVKEFDCTILCGHRDADEQHSAVVKGFSKVDWPNSKHNTLPSCAVDVAPYPIDWEDIERFNRFAAFVKQTAERMGIEVRWGGNFKSFYDGPHWEVV